MGAPVCVIEPTEPIQVPKPLQLPPIPIATDLQSALAAINAMRQNIMALLGQIAQSQQGRGGGFIANNPNNPSKAANFVEVLPLRVTQKIRVYNANDKTQYVDVQQITGLTFVDPQTQQTIQWQQNPTS